jgi:hypothetical protein
VRRVMHSCIWASIPPSKPQPCLSLDSPRPAHHWSMTLIDGRSSPLFHVSLAFLTPYIYCCSQSLMFRSTQPVVIESHLSHPTWQPTGLSSTILFIGTVFHLEADFPSLTFDNTILHLRVCESPIPRVSDSLLHPGVFGHHLSACCR